MEGWRGIEKELNDCRNTLGKIADKVSDKELLHIMLITTGDVDKISNIIFNLIKRGAILIGTENEELLNKMSKISNETEEMSKMWKNNRDIDLDKNIKNVENYALINEKRDRFIAKKINENLMRGETGILFIVAAGNTAWSETQVEDPQMKSRPLFLADQQFSFFVARGTPLGCTL